MEYLNYYKKNPKISYDIYKKTQMILYSIKKLKLNLKNKAILDVGFGTGFTLLNLIAPFHNLYGIEFIKIACLNLKSRFRGENSPIELFLANITNLPFQSQSFEMIICSHVLEHVKDDIPALNEIWRILTPQGLLIFLTPNENYGTRHDLHFRTYSSTQLEELCNPKFKLLYRVKYRSFIDNLLYKIPISYNFLNRLLNKFFFIDLFFASQFKNLEDLYIFIKKV
ncbi:MAG: class I SAM-dependent methyltransferase [Candidatus Helarchaeota archaeon]